jgi:hypothetical protein
VLSLPILLSTAALAAPADIQDALKRQAAASKHPIPTLSASNQQKLDAGEMVKVRLAGADGGALGALGLVVTDIGRNDLWMGSMDVHTKPPSDMDLHPLQPLGAELYRWYGFVDLPEPFDDRHFLIRTSIDTRLSQTNSDGVWERTWALEGGWPETARAMVDQGKFSGLDVALFDAAIETPMNQGAWTVLSLNDGRSLVAYQVATTLGGEIPDGLLNRYLFWTLEGVLKDVVAAARGMSSHYVAGHEPLIGGDGKPITPY